MQTAPRGTPFSVSILPKKNTCYTFAKNNTTTGWIIVKTALYYMG